MVLRQAWERVLGRHAVLRTSLVSEGVGRPLRWCIARWCCRGRCWTGGDGRVPARRRRPSECLDADRARGFDLRELPLTRVALLRTDDDALELVWSYHHLLLDGWSTPLVMREVFAVYEALLHGREPAPPRSRPFRDYVAWLEQHDRSRPQAYWRSALEDFTAPTPIGADGPTGRGPGECSVFGKAERRLPVASTAAVRSLPAATG